MLILLGKVLVGALPGMTQDLSWTVTNLGYMAVSHLFYVSTALMYRSPSLCFTMSLVYHLSKRESPIAVLG